MDDEYRMGEEFIYGDMKNREEANITAGS